ncbi:MAG: CDGSH iron-sulfur domain-containing protein [bacterium]
MTTKKDPTRHGVDNTMRIDVSEGGPYLVSGNVPLKVQIAKSDVSGNAIAWKAGERIETPDCYALCRCGQSDNKPFCDGSHTSVKFASKETAGDEEYLEHPEVTEGPTLSMTDIEPLCSGSRFCDAGDGTWSLVEQSGNTEAARSAIEQACNCPSGRLTVSDKTGKAIEPKLVKAIGVVEDEGTGISGPLWVQGGIPVHSADGKSYKVRKRVTLCRCGRSANKPFCDARHNDD